MNCEICGKDISYNPLRIKVDGSIMMVCKDCTKFGKIQKAPNPRIKQKRKIKQNKKYIKREEPQEELIEDFNVFVRNARERKNWTREELGSKINEKVSVIHRIEAGKMVPDIKLTKKLENILDISLIEKINDINLEEFKSKSKDGYTLGDIAKIKRK